VVFDKTGTITRGEPIVTDILSLNKELSTKEILAYAFSLENYSEHPLASAIIKKAKALSIAKLNVKNFRETEGFGVSGVIRQQHITVYKPSHQEFLLPSITKLQTEGKTVVVLKIDQKAAGVMGIGDVVKKEAKDAIRELHQLKIQTLMLSGDNQLAANFIAKAVGIDEVRAEVLPGKKAAIIKALQAQKRVVAMVGDGINDAPALAQADVGIAMSTGTDVAIESSDITLLSGNIAKVASSIILSKQTMRTIKQNLFWAFIYNLIGIPLAAGAFYPFWGILLNPIFGGLAMTMSSVSVVTNSLLLRRVKI